MPSHVGREWRATLDGMRDAVCLINPDGVIRRCNESLRLLLDKPFDKIVGRNCWRLVYGSPQAPPGCAPGERRHGGRAKPVLRLVKGRWYHVSTEPIRDAGRRVTGGVHVMADVTDLKLAEARLREYGARLDRAEEGERRRLARELHDRVGQNLTAIGINLSFVRGHLPSVAGARAAERLVEAISQVNEVSEWIRDVMGELRPAVLDDYGLIAALKWYGQQFAARRDIPVQVVAPAAWPTLSGECETALFRIVQEALTNAAKHAHATAIRIHAAVRGSTAVLTIADNGVGFDAEASRPTDKRHGWGLVTMRERAEAAGATCRVASRPGAGTRVIVSMPLARRSLRPASPVAGQVARR